MACFRKLCDHLWIWSWFSLLETSASCVKNTCCKQWTRRTNWIKLLKYLNSFSNGLPQLCPLTFCPTCLCKPELCGLTTKEDMKISQLTTQTFKRITQHPLACSIPLSLFHNAGCICVSSCHVNINRHAQNGKGSEVCGGSTQSSSTVISSYFFSFLLEPHWSVRPIRVQILFLKFQDKLSHLYLKLLVGDCNVQNSQKHHNPSKWLSCKDSEFRHRSETTEC